MTARTTPDLLAGHYRATKHGAARLKTAVTLAAATLDFPLAQLNILDAQFQHTICEPQGDEQHSIPRGDSICRLVVDGGAPLAIDDTHGDARVAAVPAVVAGQVGSYLGMPLTTRGTTGTLCVVDARSRSITPGEVNRLGHFVDIVSGHLDLMRTRTKNDLDELARAIGDREVTPAYDPIVDLQTGRVVAYEAKAQWKQSCGAVIDPAVLLPVADDINLVLEFDRVLMRRAFADAARLRRTSPELRICVNISNRHLDTPGAVHEICIATIDAGLPPSAIDLELTETEDFADEQLARNAIGTLRQYGFGVVLDDFGSGWSSLDWVLRLPVSGMKVNRAAAAALGTPIGNTLARALGGLAAQMQLDATIDGIVTAEQVDLLRTLGYRRGQGELWTVADPAEAESGLAS